MCAYLIRYTKNFYSTKFWYLIYTLRVYHKTTRHKMNRTVMGSNKTLKFIRHYIWYCRNYRKFLVDAHDKSVCSAQKWMCASKNVCEWVMCCMEFAQFCQYKSWWDCSFFIWGKIARCECVEELRIFANAFECLVRCNIVSFERFDECRTIVRTQLSIMAVSFENST